MSPYNQPWQPPATIDPSRPFTTQQTGAHPPRTMGTVNPANDGQIPPTQLPTTSLDHRGHQPPLKQHSFASGQQWPGVPPGDGGAGGLLPNLSSEPQIDNNMTSSGRRPTNNLPDATRKKCRIPDCTYPAYYDFAEQEQSEYCGQYHQLQALSSGLVASCAMCKGRPRRINERVCGRTCREQDRQARPVQGSFFGEPVVRRVP